MSPLRASKSSKDLVLEMLRGVVGLVHYFLNVLRAVIVSSGIQGLVLNRVLQLKSTERQEKPTDQSLKIPKPESVRSPETQG